MSAIGHISVNYLSTMHTLPSSYTHKGFDHAANCDICTYHQHKIEMITTGNVEDMAEFEYTLGKHRCSSDNQ